MKEKSEKLVQNTNGVVVQGLYMRKVNQNVNELDRSKSKDN